MVWVFVIIGVLIVIGLFSSASTEKEAIQNADAAQKRAEYDARTKSRAEAYADYLRRTEPAQHGLKTERELLDEIVTAMRSYQSKIEAAHRIPGLIAIAGVVGGVVMGFRDKEWFSFFFLAALGIFAAYKLDQRAVARIQASFKSKGWDPERLLTDPED